MIRSTIEVYDMTLVRRTHRGGGFGFPLGVTDGTAVKLRQALITTTVDGNTTNDPTTTGNAAGEPA